MSQRIEAKVPDIGDFDGIPVIEILVAVGDTVDKDQGLVTLESDKATMEVPSPAAGVVKELKVKLGDGVSEGKVVASGSPAELQRSDQQIVRQFMEGQADGPVPFHYPAPDYQAQLLGEAER